MTSMSFLAPFSGQLAAGGPVVFGSIAWALGTLATTLQRYEQAEGHFVVAAEIEERVGAPLFLARTHAGWARALIARGRPEDLDRAQSMLEQAADTAGRLGGKLVRWGSGGVPRRLRGDQRVAGTRPRTAGFADERASEQGPRSRGAWDENQTSFRPVSTRPHPAGSAKAAQWHRAVGVRRLRSLRNGRYWARTRHRT